MSKVYLSMKLGCYFNDWKNLFLFLRNLIDVNCVCWHNFRSVDKLRNIPISSSFSGFRVIYCSLFGCKVYRFMRYLNSNRIKVKNKCKTSLRYENFISRSIKYIDFTQYLLRKLKKNYFLLQKYKKWPMFRSFKRNGSQIRM